MRFVIEPKDSMIRVFGRSGEIAYAILGLRGLQAEIEFPSDWHDQRRAWVRLGFGFGAICFSFPWAKVVPDEYQCSGPTYGFQFYDDLLWIRYGKDKGTRDSPRIALYMPWSWRHKEHKILSAPETHPYTYVLRSGEVQHRNATIQKESRLWLRPWLPFRRYVESIDVQFSDEVGERSGSWKGGTIGCGYEMRRGETPLQTLRRMQAERKF